MSRAARRGRGATAGLLLAALALVAGCAGPSGDGRPGARPGAYYLDDGPGDAPPADLASIPDATPRTEPLHRGSTRPYAVFGRLYVPLAEVGAFRERGRASWYGRRFHGRPTANGERYDMYAMTAAHPTLPLPSYVRVTNLRNGRSVVVRVNDRGPFLNDRVIDLTYTAAWKLGYVEAGSAEVEIELLAAPEGTAVAAAPVAPVAATASESVEPASAPSTWLQLGVFASRENAESARARLQRESPWLGAAVEVIAQGGQWRVRVGPWGQREDALGVAERIAAAGVFRPIPVGR